MLVVLPLAGCSSNTCSMIQGTQDLCVPCLTAPKSTSRACIGLFPGPISRGTLGPGVNKGLLLDVK